MATPFNYNPDIPVTPPAQATPFQYDPNAPAQPSPTLGTLPFPVGRQNTAGKVIGGAFSEGVNQVKEGYNQAQLGASPMQAFEGASKIGAGAINTVLSPLAPFFAPVGQAINKVADKVSDSPTVQKFSNSEFGKNTAKGFETVSNLNTIAGGVVGAQEINPKAILQSGKDLIKGTPEEQLAKAKSNIQETISPKPTAKEAKFAQSEGRLIQGKEPTLFKAGTDDIIAPSDKVIKASETIQRAIPNADKMSETQLHSALDSKISETANNLKPEMQKVQIDKKITGDAFEQWKKLKAEQSQEADFLDNKAGNKALQNQFENRLKSLEWDITDKSGKFKAPTPKTLDDVWEIAKEYDNSIADNIKKANSMSDSKLQYRKQMWLENRAILRDIINNSESGLGETSRQAFSDMHNMYNAQEGIASKTKIETGQMSKINQFLKNNPTTAKVIGGTTVYEILRKLGLTPF